MFKGGSICVLVVGVEVVVVAMPYLIQLQQHC